jgi:aldehyde dehydrogenase (NAD+)
MPKKDCAARREPIAMNTRDLIAPLGLADLNAAACSGGAWLTGGKPFASHNPATGLPLAQAGAATRHDYDQIVDAATACFQRWRTLPAPQRGEWVRRIGVALRQNKDALGNLIALETGKIKAEADGEVQEMIDIADFAVGLSRMLHGRTLHSERLQHRLYEQWHPRGVVGVITAFNFPAAVWAWNAFIAAVAGNTVVWKPSPKAPLTAIAVQRLIQRVMQDSGFEGVFSLYVCVDPALAGAMADDARVALLSFTGSSAVGKQVAQRVAARMGQCLLECSGNNAVIVDETANLELALRAVVFGAVGTAGQRCTSTRRLMVHESRHAELKARLAAVFRSVRIGDPLDPQTVMGPLIDENARTTYVEAISRLKALGAEIICGGHTLPGAGYFVQPTLVEAVHHWDIVQQETFAPILYLMPYREFAEAIALNNAVPQGLSSSLFTENLRHAEYFLSAVGSDCGIANINCGTSGAEIGGAFGGEKDTGGGREAGSDAWKAYMRRQTNTINWGTSLPLAQGIEFNTA